MIVRKALLVFVVALVSAVGLASAARADVPGEEPIRLEGTSWAGLESLAGYGDLTFHFQDDGFVTMFDADGETLGTWRQSGLAVTLFFHDGTVLYRGTISGDSMGGTARNSRRVWRWQVSRD